MALPILRTDRIPPLRVSLLYFGFPFRTHCFQLIQGLRFVLYSSVDTVAFLGCVVSVLYENPHFSLTFDADASGHSGSCSLGRGRSSRPSEVLKPCDEEAFAPRNPRAYVGPCVCSQSSRLTRACHR